MEQIIATNERKQINYINKIDLIGSAVRKERTKSQSGFDKINLTIAVRNPRAEANSATEKPYYVKISFYGQGRVDAIDKNINPEDKPRVHIEATLRTNIDPDTHVFYQYLVGNTITLLPTEMELVSGLKGVGHRKAKGKNEACIVGEVSKVTAFTRAEGQQPTRVTLTVKVEEGGKVNFPQVVCFRHNIKRALELQKGDVVCAIGYYEDKEYESADGTIKYYKDIVAEEIDKL
jgi:hypothetical protein